MTKIALTSRAYWGYSEDLMRACVPELTISETKINDERFVYYVAESESAVTGFYCLECIEGKPFELGALFVAPGKIGNGTGRALFEHAVETSCAMGSSDLKIESDPNAAGFYENVGAELIGEAPSGSIPGRMLPLFRVELEK